MERKTNWSNFLIIFYHNTPWKAPRNLYHRQSWQLQIKAVLERGMKGCWNENWSNNKSLKASVLWLPLNRLHRGTILKCSCDSKCSWPSCAPILEFCIMWVGELYTSLIPGRALSRALSLRIRLLPQVCTTCRRLSVIKEQLNSLPLGMAGMGECWDSSKERGCSLTFLWVSVAFSAKWE